ncbi:MAG: EAL domain-containing protein [Alphaproteobacteria bacterium]
MRNKPDAHKYSMSNFFNALLHAVIPHQGISKEKFDLEHVQAMLRNAFAHGKSIQEPIYSQEAVITYESLARLKDETGHDFPIYTIANQFYDDGLSEEFDLLTCSMGMEHADKLPISLNVSVKSILNTLFCTKLQEMTKNYSLENSDIIIEILEHDVALDAEIDHLLQMKKDGFRFALDDISYTPRDKGTSRENRNRIKIFSNISTFAKIDGALVRAYLENGYESKNKNGKLVQYTPNDLTTLIDTLQRRIPHAQIIAEHVKNKDEADIMFDLGINGVQGWDLKLTDFPEIEKPKNRTKTELRPS